MGLRDRHKYKEFNCFFVTTSCINFMPIIDITNSYHTLEQSLSFLCLKYKVDILAYVIMPNHIHLILYFKEENKLSDYMRDLKKYTSVLMIKNIKEQGQYSLLRTLEIHESGRQYQVWQNRFDDLFLESKWCLEQKLDYIHSNPLQEHWQLVKDETDYQYSSAKYYYLDQETGLDVTHYGKYF